MNCVFISDLHIRKSDDRAADLFRRFCSHSKTLNADKIFLLGDIFDHLAGDHPEFLKEYSFFFEALESFLEHDKEVIFVEGNHDFHFQGIIETYLSHHRRYHKKFRYLKGGENIILEGQKYHFCHGYEVDYFNTAFKRWHAIYTSNYFKFFVSKILNFKLFMMIANWASNNSKKRGKKSFEIDKMRMKYLEGAFELSKDLSVQGIIAGHTHIPENHLFSNGVRYINCGFPLRDKQFISFDQTGFNLTSLV